MTRTVLKDNTISDTNGDFTRIDRSPAASDHFCANSVSNKV